MRGIPLRCPYLYTINGESGRESVSDWRMHRHFKIKYTGDESDRYRLSEKSEPGLPGYE